MLCMINLRLEKKGGREADTVWARSLFAAGMSSTRDKCSLALNIFCDIPRENTGLVELVEYCAISDGEQTCRADLAGIRQLVINCLLDQLELKQNQSRLQFLQTYQIDLLKGVSVPVSVPGFSGDKTTVDHNTRVSIYATSTYRYANNNLGQCVMLL